MMLDTADKVFTIDPSGVATGATTANAWAGFESPVQKVFDDGGHRYFGGAPGGSGAWGDTAFLTKASGRDQEVSFKMAQTYQGVTVYLRYDGSAAVRFSLNRFDDIIRTFYVSSVGRIFKNNGSGEDAGVDKSFDGVPSEGLTLSTLTGGTYSVNDVWTFGCVGDLFYAKLNGMTYWSGRLWQHTKSGKIAVMIDANDARGFRDVSCTFKASAPSFTDYDNKVVDLRDWGWRDSRAVGSMSAGSYDLTGVANAADFAVGDPIIVEIGGEAGAGELGTKGVGGTYPTYSYANEASLPNAATWRSTYVSVGDNNGKLVWLEDTGKVWLNYISSGVPTWGNWTDTQDDRSYHYSRYVAPRALRAKITAISGTTITLDRAAVVATTNANVYYDCSPAILAAFCPGSKNNMNIYVPGAVWRIPPGTFAATGAFPMSAGTAWFLAGAGRAQTHLYTPKGCENISISQPGRNAVIQDFKVSGWNGFKYWCFNTDTDFGSLNPAVAISQTSEYGGSNTDGGVIRRVDTENCFVGYQLVNRIGGLVYDCDTIQSAGNNQTYAGWYYQVVSGQDGWIEDCTYTAENVAGAFELFRADSGGIRNCKAVNGLVASNSSGGYVYEDLDLTIDCGAWPTNGWLAADGYGININNNIGVDSAILNKGGEIRNPKITMTKRVSDGFQTAGIVINDTPNVSIIGTHPSKPGEGAITMSDYNASDSSGARGAVGIAVAGGASGAVVQGIRVIGAAQGANFSNIYSYRTDTVIEDNVGDTIMQFNGSVNVSKLGTNGNITNAAYDAL